MIARAKFRADQIIVAVFQGWSAPKSMTTFRPNRRTKDADGPARPSAGVAKASANAIRPRDPDRLARLAELVSRQRFETKDILFNQAEIHRLTLSLSRTIDRPNFRRVDVDDLRRMIRMYDERFFGGRLLPHAEAEGLTFGLSKRMTRIAGKMVTHYSTDRIRGPRKFELVLSSTLLFQTFRDVDRPVEVTGRRCRDRLEAMQRIAEHELVHLTEMLIWNDGNCDQARFQSIARRYFAHTDYQHDLITQQERAARKFNLRVGDAVRFRFQDRWLVGRINRITRRATVLVEDPKGETFSDGGRYLRYYVPLEHLQRA
ncbi:hypothetical protein V7x_17720 [Crateriforma conspicua]|uniref:SprT-like family protein n=2 Tax=Planctomycetaceae TaxID=126 RepID=A0A5C6FYW1_9PLAN|nr:hypothetical protein V7x_17720 [Crateriforma conspicua]